jgi:hypothetical protein
MMNQNPGVLAELEQLSPAVHSLHNQNVRKLGMGTAASFNLEF